MSNLLVNGGFTEAGYTPNPVVAASGQHGRVSVEDFPGSATAALRISPTGTAASTSATIATVAATRPVGWYKVELFVFAPTGYNGKGSPLTVDAVDGSGTTLMSSSTVVSLRDARDEWLHYSAWVPSNTAGQSSARVLVNTGGCDNTVSVRIC